jgi:hypothetical protein
MSTELDGLLEKFIANNAQDTDVRGLTDSISIGFVVDTDDPLQQGRIRVFCPAYNDDPKKILHLPWCVYVSPVAGSINQDSYTRGHDAENATSSGPVHYGFWAIPEVGAHVIVGCINADRRRRIWLGCIPNHQETHTMGHGRFKHSENSVNGPLTSTGGPIEPTATKLKEAFGGDISSSEWKTRGADYQITSVTDRPSPEKSAYVDDSYSDIADSEEDEWVKEVLGEHGYDWTSYKNLGAFLASKVYGWTTPGFHSITMDDRAFNCRVRFRTAGGHQIIMDDTNERIYFSTGEGKSWIELDSAGNIDVFAERRMSIHAEKDLNFSAGESIRFKADKFISMYAGNDTGQTPLTEQLADGEIRIQSANDMHIKVGQHLQMNVDNNFAATFGSDGGGTTNIDFKGAVNFGMDGAFGVSALGDINLSADDVTFGIAGKGTTIDTLTTFLDDLVDTFNSHAHVNAGENLNPADPIDIPDPVTITIVEDETKLAPWANRVPEHEPWPRVMMQDSDDAVNSENDGYLNNVDWVKQYTNVDEAGRKPIGKTEGDETIERGKFWRR